MSARKIAFAAAAGAAGLAILFYLARPRPEPTPRPVPVAPAVDSPRPAPPPPLPIQDLLSALARATASDERPPLVASARALRAALLADASLLPAAVRVLRDPSAPIALRQAVAVVLGTLHLGDGKRELARALREGAVAGLERTVLLALGIKALEDGEEFERDGQPYAVETAPGLTVHVRGPLLDSEARQEAERWLAAGPGSTERRAAARVLRDSTEFPETRGALLDRVDRDADAETAAEAAAALAVWTRVAKQGDAERGRVVDRLFEAVPRSEEVLRFRLTGPLASTPLEAHEVQRLRSLTVSPDADVRTFAADVLGRRFGISTADDRESVSLLRNVLSADPSPDVRETAALALVQAAREPAVVESLVSALRRDADWEVRAAAVTALAQARGSDLAQAALGAAAAGDPHPDVRAAARQALRK